MERFSHQTRKLLHSFLFSRTKKAAFLAMLMLSLSVSIVKAQNAIVLENQKAGNPASEWDVSGSGDASIQGFATDISVNKGETVHFKVNTDATAYTITVYRLGYYGGNGARKVGTGIVTATLPQRQPAALVDKNTGLIDCGNWAESGNWAVPADAVSGVYIARLRRTDNGGASHMIFIVRDDGSTSDLYFQTSDATWQAYNVYGGNSLYVGNTSFPGGHAAKVSYNRPFVTRDGGGGGGAAEDWIFNAEYPMIRWLERNGYDMTYTTDVDVDRRGSLIKNHKVYMSVGHDEYWSGQQRANVEAARAAGVHLAFFSGNEVYWKTRWEQSIDGTGTPYRTLVCYKEGTLGENSCGGKCDPLSTVWTGLWRDGCDFSQADGCRPENALGGQISWYDVTSAIKVPATYKGYRFWRNTSIATLSSGTTATLSSGTLGYEWDFEQYPNSYPQGRVRMSSTTVNSNTHQLSLYRHSSGALVFGAGTVQWSWGLDGTHDRGGSTPDARMQQATVNLLADMGAQPGSIQSGITAATAVSDRSGPNTVISSPQNGAVVKAGVAVTISGTATEVGGGVVAGVDVSVDGGITWKPATGTSSWTFTWTPPSNGNYTIKSRGLDDMGNLESATTSSNTIQVSTNATTCTPPTATLAAGAADCSGQSIALKLSAATGTGPYTAVVNNTTYNNVTVGQTFATVSTEQSIWGSSGTPTELNDNDNQAIEVGVKFRASQAGTITGVRFYKGNLNTGTHVGSLWTSTGTKLASATFSNETASGWQEVRFATPVSITANTTYVASYSSPGGGYAATTDFFTNAATGNGSLTALKSGTDGGNGVYTYGSGFPTSTFSGSNYWVDVLFKPGTSYTFTLTSLTDAAGCNNTGTLSTATVTQSDLQSSGTTWYRDSDGDGYGTSATTTQACTQPTGYVARGGDCDDNNANVNPGKTEVCGNGIDDNCDGQVDEGCTTGTTWYRDSDGDGYGNAAVSTTATTQPTGYVSNSTDCNDTDASINPGATEVCDGKDNNCNGSIDEGFTPTTWYRDADGDGYGSTTVTTTACTQPSGYIAQGGDCNDANANVNPGKTEVCGNGIDDNCNGSIDEGCPVTEQSIWGTSGTPTVLNDNDNQAIEVGVKFRVSQSGTITGVRFYKGNLNTGTHVGSLWTSTGTKLASATFSNETASGWQEVRFATPVSITANTTYVASYSSPRYYSSSVNYFSSSARTTGAITALRTGTDGPNGVYKLGGGFPTKGYKGSNYWVDVLFVPNTTTTTMLTSTRLSTAVPETRAGLRLAALPNPSATSFTLQVQGPGSQPIQLRIVDVLGRLVETRLLPAAGTTLLVGQRYRPGLYFAQATQGTLKQTLKLLKSQQ